MPTYEYKCTKCEEMFEVFQKMTDIPLKECPVCGGELQKVISGGIGIIFKGSGFYSTDSKHSSATAIGSSPAPASSDTKATADGGKDGAQNNGKSKDEGQSKELNRKDQKHKDEKKSVETANS
jgi:putative FmdB family regulatory protein